MKRFARSLLGLLLIFTVCALRAQTSSVFTVEQNGTRANSINLVFLSEGYTAGEMTKFADDVQEAVDFLFTKEPWVRYRPYCNVYRIQIASNQSGTDSTYTPRETPVVRRDTYFESGFVTNGVDRNNSITATGQSRVYSLLNKHVPEYDIPIVLVNDDTYGGSGGPVAVATTNYYSAGIVEHELGHSFANLTDEYDVDTPGYPATEFPNATAKTARADIRWKIWIDDTTPLPTPETEIPFSPFTVENSVVGLYEGANYRAAGWYRPHDNALMRNLNQEPGSITREAFVLKYYSKIDPIDAHAPAALTQTHASQVELNFSVTPKTVATGPALAVQWLVNNVPQGATGAAFGIASKTLGNGTHTVKAVVRDPTDWVRRDPSGSLSESRTWTVKLSNQIDPPFTLNNPLPSTVVLAPGNGITLDATATDSGTLGYEWLKNNKPLNPAVTTPALNLYLYPYDVSTAGTYSVKISNGVTSVTHSVVVAVFDSLTDLSDSSRRVVVARGGTATLAFPASANLPPVTWSVGESVLANGGRHSGATTRSLTIKNVTAADAGYYYFSVLGQGGSTIELRVVTAPPDYSAITPVLPAAIVAGAYRFQFPFSDSPDRLPTSFQAKLPSGLALDRATGLITGVPTAASRDQVNGDAITFSIANAFGKTTVVARLLVKPLPPGIAGSYAGLVPGLNTLGGSTGGRIDLTITNSGSYTGVIVVGAERLPIAGFVSVDFTPPATVNGVSAFASARPSFVSEPLGIRFTLGDGRLQAVSTLVSPTPDATPAFTFEAWRNPWAKPESTDTFKGYYTFNLQPFDTPGDLTGLGFGSVTIDAEGNAKVTGRLPDGEPFTTSGPVGPEGEIVIYQVLYTSQEKGSFAGVLEFEFGSTPREDNFNQLVPLRWVRPADPRPSARAFKPGFDSSTIGIYGGRYVPPAKNTIIRGLPAATGTPAQNGLVLLAPPGDIAIIAGLDIKVGGSAKVAGPNPNKVTFAVTPATGAFKGRYTTVDDDPRGAPPAFPRITRTVDFQGMVINTFGRELGFGYFLRPALPDPATGTTPATSPIESGYVIFGGLF